MKFASFPVCICFLIVVLFFTEGLAQNLIKNPGNEKPLDETEIQDWVEVSGTDWKQRSNNPEPGEAGYYFFAGKSEVAELAQDVDVSSMAAEIDQGTFKFEFTAYVMSYTQLLDGEPDEARITLEYLDLANNILETFDSGGISSTEDWHLVEDIREAAIGTRTIRVRLISTRKTGSNNDGYFDKLTLVAQDLTPLELLYFKGTEDKEGQHLLDWVSLTEVNNEGFTVEHSLNGNSWDEIGFVQRYRRGNLAQSYVFVNSSPREGTIFYRLRTQDANAKMSYSQIVELNSNGKKEYWIYPIPAQESESIQISGSLWLESVVVTDYLGKKVINQTGIKSTEWLIPTDGLSQGQYVVRINNKYSHIILIQ